MASRSQRSSSGTKFNAELFLGAGERTDEEFPRIFGAGSVKPDKHSQSMKMLGSCMMLHGMVQYGMVWYGIIYIYI